MDGGWMVAAAFVAAFGGGVALSLGLASTIRRVLHAHRELQQEVIVADTTSSYFRMLMPVARRIGESLHAAFEGDRPEPGWFAHLHRRFGRELAGAGYPQGLTTNEFVGFMVLAGLFGGGGGVVYFLIDGTLGIDLCFIIGGLLGIIAQRMWLNRQRLERQTRIRKQLPFALDLMCLSTEAGLDFASALGGICQKLGKSPLGDEFSIMLREIQLGKTRSNAMRDLSNRVDVNEMRSVMASLLQAEELGTPIAPVLRIQAAQQRERRGQRAEETANKAPVKMLFPLLLFFGATLLLVIGPILIEFL